MIPSLIISTARNQTGCTTDVVSATQSFQFLNQVEEDFWRDICNESPGDKMNQFNINLVSGTATNTSTAMTALGTTANVLTFGYRQYSGSNKYYYGLLDEIGIWSRVITTDEMAAIYNGGNGLPFSGFAGGNTTNFFQMF